MLGSFSLDVSVESVPPTPNLPEEHLRLIKRGRDSRRQTTEQLTNLQVQGRPRKIFRPNDKLSGKVFNQSADNCTAMLEDGAEAQFVEMTRKGKKIYTSFWLEAVGDCCDFEPLNEFDFAVLTACISFFEGGFPDVSVDMLFRLMTGSKRVHARPEQRAEILASVDKMMCRRIKIDMSDVCRAVKKYDSRLSKPVITSTILPCKRLSAKINGKQADVIHFFEESPLMTVARAKRQILTFASDELAVPNLNNTSRVVMLKFYVVERVREVIQQNLKPASVTFADVFKKCGLSDATRWQQQDARKAIRAVFEHLKAQGVILTFEEKMTCGACHGISFTYG